MSKNNLPKIKANKKEVAIRLQAIRINLGWTVSEMAEQIGTTQANLSSYLRGLALPPTKFIESLSALTNYPVRWIYYGDIKEYIRAVIEFYGYEKVVLALPNIADNVYFELEKLSLEGGDDYPEETDVLKAFNVYYDTFFHNYLTDLLQVFIGEITHYPLHTESKELNKEKFVSRVKTLLNIEIPKIQYGDDYKILQIAKEEFERRKKFYESLIKSEK